MQIYSDTPSLVGAVCIVRAKCIEQQMQTFSHVCLYEYADHIISNKIHEILSEEVKKNKNVPQAQQFIKPCLVLGQFLCLYLQ